MYMRCSTGLWRASWVQSAKKKMNGKILILLIKLNKSSLELQLGFGVSFNIVKQVKQNTAVERCLKMESVWINTRGLPSVVLVLSVHTLLTVRGWSSTAEVSPACVFLINLLFLIRAALNWGARLRWQPLRRSLQPRRMRGAARVGGGARRQDGGLPAVAPLRLLRQGGGEGAAGPGGLRREALRAAPGRHGVRLGPGEPRVRGYPRRGGGAGRSGLAGGAWWSCAQAPALCRSRRYLLPCS